MNRVVRAILTCLLLVAVPMQGYAAAGMLFCGQATGTRSESAPHHHDAGAVTDDSRSVTAAAGDAKGDVHEPGMCSVCSSCCSAAALPSSVIVAASYTPRSTPALDTERTDPGHGPARLERPPRPLA